MAALVDILAVGGIVASLMNLVETPKTRAIRKAYSLVKKGKLVPGYVHHSGKHIISVTVFEQENFSEHLVGAVIAQFGREIPFNNLDEMIEAENTALALYHYRRSFIQYNCTAGE